MSHNGPFFYAWCPDNERVAAYAEALSVLVSPNNPESREELVEEVRARFASATSIEDDRYYPLLSGDEITLHFAAWRDSYDYRDCAPLVLVPEHQFDMLFLKMPMARGGSRSVNIESAIFSIVSFENTIDLLQRLCAPDETSRVTTGACTWGKWDSPLDACITYNADANVGRDLALAWLHGHDETPTEGIVGLDLGALRARIVNATATRAQMAQASMVEFVEEYSVIIPRWNAREWCVEFPQPAAYELTREQVLAVLETPPARLLEALESVAVPDAEWRAVEPIAREDIAAKKRGAPTEEVAVNTRRHVRFIEQHAPFHVRRLHNGGVMLATHPYRTLWPLWSSALDLLGIRAKTA